MYKAPDRLAVRQLEDAYLMTETCNGWFACPGGDGNRIVPMATCTQCAAHITLRRALKRLGIEPPKDIHDKYREQEARFQELRNK